MSPFTKNALGFTVVVVVVVVVVDLLTGVVAVVEMKSLSGLVSPLTKNALGLTVVVVVLLTGGVVVVLVTGVAVVVVFLTGVVSMTTLVKVISGTEKSPTFSSKTLSVDKKSVVFSADDVLASVRICFRLEFDDTG